MKKFAIGDAIEVVIVKLNLLGGGETTATEWVPGTVNEATDKMGAVGVTLGDGRKILLPGHLGLFREPVGEAGVVDPRPANCRERLRAEGKPYPRSSCERCWKGKIGVMRKRACLWTEWAERNGKG